MTFREFLSQVEEAALRGIKDFDPTKKPCVVRTHLNQGGNARMNVFKAVKPHSNFRLGKSSIKSNTKKPHI